MRRRGRSSRLGTAPALFFNSSRSWSIAFTVATSLEKTLVSAVTTSFSELALTSCSTAATRLLACVVRPLNALPNAPVGIS